MHRTAGDCPVCDQSFGSVELVGEGRDRVRYWHADLRDGKEYCDQFMDGEAKEIRTGVRRARVE